MDNGTVVASLRTQQAFGSSVLTIIDVIIINPLVVTIIRIESR